MRKQTLGLAMWIICACKQVGGGKVIAGFDAAVTGLEVGGMRAQRVPPEQAYGVLLVLHKLIHWMSVNSPAHPSTSGLPRPTAKASVAFAPSRQMAAV